jgi:hypothetical protein
MGPSNRRLLNQSTHSSVANSTSSTVRQGPDKYVGVRGVADEVWLVGRPDPSFMDYDLGFFCRALNRVEPVGVNPFAPKVSPMCSE